jgi:hypothetical protein
MIETRTPSQWNVHLPFLLASSAACLLWSWLAGRDLNWDQLNYHVYAAYQFLDDRLDKDFMAASIQGYLNPLAYVPFYLMVRAQWHSLLIGSLLALLHSTCLWLIYGISRTLIPATTPYRVPLLAACVALAFLAPVYLVEIGSSFIDVTTAIPVLAAVLLLMRGPQHQNYRAAAAAAGVLLGCATALKLTNAIFAIAAVAFVAMADRPIGERMRALGIYAAGGVAGAVLTGGAWSYRLLKTFASPFFPWFNAWFRSPDFPLFNITSYRFMPETIGDFLLLPITMLDVGMRTYTETMAPDSRLLDFLLILVCLGIAFLYRVFRTAAPPTGNEVVRVAPVYAPALVFCLASYVLWLLTSGNGRYAIPLLLLVGPMIPASVLAFTGSQRVIAYALGGLILVQGAILYPIGAIRWTSAQWKSTWFDVDVPERFRTQPFLFLSLNRQTAAFLAPLVHRDSSFVNLVGQVSLALNRPGGDRLRSLLERHRSGTRTLMLTGVRLRTPDQLKRAAKLQNDLLADVGLEVDGTDCVTFEMSDLAGSMPVVAPQSPKSNSGGMMYKTNFLTCATKPAQPTSADQSLVARVEKTNRAFARLEAACPRIFSPPNPHTDNLYGTLRRDYVNSDTVLSEDDGTILYEGFLSRTPVALGRREDIADGIVQIHCGHGLGRRSLFPD